MAVQDGAQQAHLEGGQVVHGGHEGGLVDGHEAVEGLLEDLLHDIAARERVADGAEVVDVPDVVAEEAADAEQQVAVDDLARGQEALHDVVEDVARVDGRDAQALGLAPEPALDAENLVHGVDLRAQEDVRGAAGELRRQGLEHFLQLLAEAVAVLGLHDVLEFVDHDDALHARPHPDAVREQVCGQQVRLLQGAIQRKRFAEGAEAVLVEDEMRVREELPRSGGQLGGAAAERGQHAAGEPQGEVRLRADVEQAQLYGDELGPGGLHRVEALLHERFAAGFRRLVDDDVLPLREQVGESAHLNAATQELFSDDAFVVLKDIVHGANV